jgi:DNA-binding transcriptional LysR family regulator
VRLEWLEDILAVIEEGSLAAAAEHRRVTQSAFSRRIRSIEEALGVPLFDRTSKPVKPSPAVLKQVNSMRRARADLREIRNELRQSDQEMQNQLVVVSQHSISTTAASEVVARLAERAPELSVRLRSANHHDCLVQLATLQADAMLIYRRQSDPVISQKQPFESVDLRHERLVPVAADAELVPDAGANASLPIVAYPVHVFLGEIMITEILPNLPDGWRITLRTETALTLAALRFAIDGLAVAWLPESLVKPALDERRLVDLSDRLPSTPLVLTAVRRFELMEGPLQTLWDVLCGLRL